MKRYAILRREDGGTAKRGGARSSSMPEGTSRPKLTVERISDKAAAELAADPRVTVATPTMPTALIKPLEAGTASEGAVWGIAAVGADRSAFDGAGVTIAVLDTGIEHDHPAFAGVTLVEKDFTGEGNGDGNGHGTHCAGTIFGRDVEGAGRIGIARGVTRALVGKVLGDKGSGQSDMVFSALTWAMQDRADIISMSLGFDFPGMVSDLVEDGWPADLATSNALEAYRGNLRMFNAIMGVLRAQVAFGVSPLVVAAAGNESRRQVDRQYRIAASLPAAADEVVSVAAVGRRDGNFFIADFSNSLATVSAPGVDIRSAWPGKGLMTISGTSMACPHVAGVAALWWQAVRQSGTMPSGRNVAARLSATASKGHFAEEVDESDIGEGVVTAPIGSA